MGPNKNRTWETKLRAASPALAVALASWAVGALRRNLRTGEIFELMWVRLKIGYTLISMGYYYYYSIMFPIEMVIWMIYPIFRQTHIHMGILLEHHRNISHERALTWDNHQITAGVSSNPCDWLLESNLYMILKYIYIYIIIYTGQSLVQ